MYLIFQEHRNQKGLSIISLLGKKENENKGKIKERKKKKQLGKTLD